ncbi:MAG: transporter substrate-binding domain-containing protein [Aliidongia sp.]
MKHFGHGARRRFSCVAGSIFLATLLALPCRPSQGATLTVAVEDADNRPLEYVDAEDRPTGFHIELVRQVAAELGWQVAFDRVPWQRAQALLEAGSVDAVTYLVRRPGARGLCTVPARQCTDPERCRSLDPQDARRRDPLGAAAVAYDDALAFRRRAGLVL